MISTNAKIAIIDTTRGMEVLCYGNRLEAVRALMESARIAPIPDYYAGPEHEAAVRNIRDHCDVVLAAIKKDQKEEEDAANARLVPDRGDSA